MNVYDFQQRLKETIQEKPGTLYEIMQRHFLKDFSNTTVERTLEAMRKTGKIDRKGDVYYPKKERRFR